MYPQRQPEVRRAVRVRGVRRGGRRAAADGQPDEPRRRGARRDRLQHVRAAHDPGRDRRLARRVRGARVVLPRRARRRERRPSAPRRRRCPLGAPREASCSRSPARASRRIRCSRRSASRCGRSPRRRRSICLAAARRGGVPTAARRRGRELGAVAVRVRRARARDRARARRRDRRARAAVRGARRRRSPTIGAVAAVGLGAASTTTRWRCSTRSRSPARRTRSCSRRWSAATSGRGYCRSARSPACCGCTRCAAQGVDGPAPHVRPGRRDRHDAVADRVARGAVARVSVAEVRWRPPADPRGREHRCGVARRLLAGFHATKGHQEANPWHSQQLLAVRFEGAVATLGVSDRVAFLRKTYAHLGVALIAFAAITGGMMRFAPEISFKFSRWALQGRLELAPRDRPVHGRRLRRRAARALRDVARPAVRRPRHRRRRRGRSCSSRCCGSLLLKFGDRAALRRRVAQRPGGRSSCRRS